MNDHDVPENLIPPGGAAGLLHCVRSYVNRGERGERGAWRRARGRRLFVGKGETPGRLAAAGPAKKAPAVAPARQRRTAEILTTPSPWRT